MKTLILIGLLIAPFRRLDKPLNSVRAASALIPTVGGVS